MGPGARRIALVGSNPNMRTKPATFLTSSVASELVQSIAAAIGADTVVVTMFSEKRSRELAQGSWVARAWLRFMTDWVFPAKLYAKIRFSPRNSVWIVSTNPYNAAFRVLRAVRARDVKMVHLVLDLYPEALEAAGTIKRGSGCSLRISAGTREVQSGCAGSVYLGELLRRHAEARHGAAKVGTVIDASTDPSRFSRNGSTGEFPLTLHCGGQIGGSHDPDSLLAMIVGTKRDRVDGLITFDFRVSGAGARRLMAVNGSEGVVIGAPMDFESWREHVSAFKIGIVTLSPAGALSCIPTEVYRLMAAGCAILAICPAWSDLGRLVRETACGWVIDNSAVDEAPDWGENGIDGAALLRRSGMEVGNEAASILHRVLETPRRVDEFRANSLAAARTAFGNSSMAAAWHDFLSKVRHSK